MRICYTIMEATKFASFAEGGKAADICQSEHEEWFIYHLTRVSGGVVVQVYDGSQLKGYLCHTITPTVA